MISIRLSFTRKLVERSRLMQGFTVLHKTLETTDILGSFHVQNCNFFNITVKSRWIDTLWQGSRKFWLTLRGKSCREPVCGDRIFPRHIGSHIGLHTQCVLHAERFSDSRAQVCQFIETIQHCPHKIRSKIQKSNFLQNFHFLFQFYILPWPSSSIKGLRSILNSPLLPYAPQITRKTEAKRTVLQIVSVKEKPSRRRGDQWDLKRKRKKRPL